MNYLNPCLMILEIISIFLILYKLIKTKGFIYLDYILIISTILSNLFATKRIEIFSLDINLGFILNLLIYIIANIMVQRKGPNIIKQILLKVVIINIFLCLLLTAASLIISSNYNMITNIAYNDLFLNNIRFNISNIITLIICLPISANVYYFVKKEQNKVWISNFLTIIITQFFEAILFITMSYLFKLEIIEIIFLIISRYILRTCIGLLSTLILVPISKIED